MKTHSALVALAVAAILVVSACGGGDDATAEGSTPDSDVAAVTVSVSTVEGVGQVLVDADGAALYAAAQEADGAVLCIDSCAVAWEPLTVSGDPVGGEGLDGRLGVVPRPDGTRQVTLDGRLLYRFAEDRSGTVTGNGLADTFGEKDFTWHVATPAGISTSSANSSPSGSPYEGGGYGQ
jgi:predicted lipoprotein with Yx(FWY)xxD motif